MSSFSKQGYCEFCPVDVSVGCPVCGSNSVDTLLLDIGIRILMDSCTGLDSKTTYWLTGSRE